MLLLNLQSDYAKIDIIFDIYIIYSIKDTKQNRRNALEGFSTNIFESEQRLPIDAKNFWAVSENNEISAFFY